ncbi:2'-5' RNA ligase family protein [Halanaeroarchaeum sulfurireducens]|uniref:Phosphoesterase HXTX n=1 Tax=Halanaeroarchaeum sulfurireducens TaxID=1604004 RepID=A0A0F7PG68_9EURY|nr:2'-5' RNA ligase family protein [Halanaeroarchaeum sulfurireducens]AKH98594.1 phosphoesterase HXTX [Halanaeroarchaeum sulfurireducens]
MYSLNVPLPPAVHDLTSSLRPRLVGFDRVRDSRTRTLVIKRLDADDRREYLGVERRAKKALRGAPAFEARIGDVGVFRDPPRGPAPVVYLAVESPGLRSIHERLTDALGAVPDLEGDGYTPHVTLARGGGGRAIDRLRDATFEPVTWTVDELEFYDARHAERIDAVPLPA